MTGGCAHCDSDLTGLKATARFCTAACRTAAYRRRRDDAGLLPGPDLFAALRGRVTSHRPISGPLRTRHRAT